MNQDTLPVPNRMPPEAVDVLIVLGAVALVALIVVFCVVYFRNEEKHRRKHHHHHHHHHGKSYREQIQITASGIKELIRQRKRRHHHGHRSLNPTLAQTGGLPPLRGENEPPPPPPPSPQP